MRSELANMKYREYGHAVADYCPVSVILADRTPDLGGQTSLRRSALARLPAVTACTAPYLVFRDRANFTETGHRSRRQDNYEQSRSVLANETN